MNMSSNVISAGFDTEGLSSAVWPGGETEALTRLERHLERKVSQIRLNIKQGFYWLFSDSKETLSNLFN